MARQQPDPRPPGQRLAEDFPALNAQLQRLLKRAKEKGLPFVRYGDPDDIRPSASA